MTQSGRKLRVLPLPVTALIIGLLVGTALLLYYEVRHRALLTTEIAAAANLESARRAQHLDALLQRVMADYQARVEALGGSALMARHVARHDWQAPRDEILVHDWHSPPDWLVPGFWQGMGRPARVLLLDRDLRLRSQVADGTAPELPVTEVLGYIKRREPSPLLFVYDDLPYLMAFGPLADGTGTPQGQVVLVLPVDSSWIADVLGVDDVVLAAANWKPVRAATEDAGSVYRSIPAHPTPNPGGSVLHWYLPRADAEDAALLELVLEIDRGDRLLIVFIFALTVLVFALGVTHWLREMYARVRRYSRHMLQMTPPPEVRGNQLLLLEQWIRSLIRLVREAEDARRSQHETEILRSEAVKSAVLDASLDSIVTIDAQGVIIDFNPAAVTTFGYRREEAIGKSIQELLLRPASRARFDRQLAVVGKSWDRRSSPRLHDLQAVARNGRVLEAEVALQPTAVGEEMLYAVYLRDMTSRRKQEEEIRNLAAFPHESPMPVLRVNRPGVVVYANSPSDVLLAHWGCRRLQTLPIYWRQQVEEVLQTGQARELEVGTDDGLYSLLLSPNPVLGYVNIYGRDVTEMRRAEEEARRRQNELVHVARLSTMGEMATGIAHELNQPLSAIVNFANGCVRRLKFGAGGTEDLLHALSQISAQATRAGEIIKRLRAMVGKQQPVREVLDLNQLVREVCQLVAHEASQLDIAFEQELSTVPLMVRVDGVQIEQVLLNVLRNAIDSLDGNEVDEPRIRIASARMAHDLVCVAIEDNGPGIPPKVKEHLFDPFFTTKETGMGMGLAISQTIVAEHNGRMHAESWPGRGAVFTMELPAAMERTESVA